VFAGEFPAPLCFENEKRVHQRLIAMMKGQQEKYPTTFAEDKEIYST
jgi:hypothetical protein